MQALARQDVDGWLGDYCTVTATTAPVPVS